METVFIVISIILILIIIFGKTDEKSLEEQFFDDEQELDINWRDRFHNIKEPEFYHPVTGYKGTKSEMDAYIINREKELKQR